MDVMSLFYFLFIRIPFFMVEFRLFCCNDFLIYILFSIWRDYVDMSVTFEIFENNLFEDLKVRENSCILH